MYKYQLTFTQPTSSSKSKKFEVFESQSQAVALLSEYDILKKIKNPATANAVEITKVLYQDGKPCTAKLVLRQYVSNKKFIEVPKKGSKGK